MIFFTVIIPVYNVSPYLRRAVDSVLNQDYGEPMEIILIDDGSTDDSGKICDKYRDNNADIQVIHTPNGGLSSARNAGLQVSTGEYIVFLDSDDWLDIDALKTFQNAILNRKVDVLAFSYKRVTEEEIVFEDAFENVSKNSVLPMSEFLTQLYLRPDSRRQVYRRSAWNHVYKRRLLEEENLSFINGIFYEDIPFLATLDCCGQTILLLDYYGYNYFQRHDSILRKKDVSHQKK